MLGLGLGFAMANQMAGGLGGAAGMAPPPLPSAWHVAEGGQSHGPLGMTQLAAWVAEGRLTATTMVWTAGMGGWTPAGQMPQLAALFGPPSPPPPPPAN